MIKFLHAVFYSLSIFRSIITIIRLLIWLIWPILYVWRDRLTLHLKIPLFCSHFLDGMQVERHWPFKNDFLGTKRSQLNTFYIRPSVLAYVRNASKLAEHLSLLLSPRSTCLMSLGDFWRPPYVHTSPVSMRHNDDKKSCIGEEDHEDLKTWKDRNEG